MPGVFDFAAKASYMHVYGAGVAGIVIAPMTQIVAVVRQAVTMFIHAQHLHLAVDAPFYTYIRETTTAL